LVEITNELLAAAGTAMGGRVLRPVAELVSSSRSAVLRALVDDGPDTVIVKTYDLSRDPEAWLRESASLSIVNGCGAPALLADLAEPPLVVLEDLGAGPSVADALLRGDADSATSAMTDWARALAGLHTATARAGGTFADALAARSGTAAPAVDSMPGMLDRSVAMLAEFVSALGITASRNAFTELRHAADSFNSTAVALTPADACPDNNISTADGLKLLDFERATVRPVAWDLAYLTVPWPSCWCCWKIPEEVTATALAAWREQVAPELSHVATGAFEGELAVATTMWAIATCAWFLPRAEPKFRFADSPEHPAPTIRAAIQHRLETAIATGAGALPALASLAERALAATRRLWGDEPLDFAPAFRRLAVTGRKD
jgi:hypothetical protein